MALKPRGTWNMPNGAPPPREPMLNLPTSIMVLGGIMIAIQALQSFVLDSAQRQEFLLAFSFLPMRFNAVTAGIAFPGGVLGDIWTFVTYAFLHGSWMHLILNLVWMAAFATVLQRRIGTRNFLIFFCDHGRRWGRGSPVPACGQWLAACWCLRSSVRSDGCKRALCLLGGRICWHSWHLSRALSDPFGTTPQSTGGDVP